MVLAFWTDTTRIVTFMLANDNSRLVFDFLGINEEHHYISHFVRHPGVEAIRRFNAITRWHVAQFAYLIDRLAKIEEGEGTAAGQLPPALRLGPETRRLPYRRRPARRPRRRRRRHAQDGPMGPLPRAAAVREPAAVAAAPPRASTRRASARAPVRCPASTVRWARDGRDRRWNLARRLRDGPN